METEKYRDSYSEESFWDKLLKYAKKTGRTVVLNALKLYYAMSLGKATPAQILTIVGALGYFISPIDAVPDALPGGFIDDAGVLAGVVKLLVCCSDKDVVAAAESKVSELFD